MFSEDERVEANADFDEPKDEIAERIFRIRSKYIPCPQETKVRQYIDRLYRTGRGNPAIGESPDMRSEEHTSELPSLMRSSYAVFCLTTKTPPRRWYPAEI